MTPQELLDAIREVTTHKAFGVLKVQHYPSTVYLMSFRPAVVATWGGFSSPSATSIYIKGDSLEEIIQRGLCVTRRLKQEEDYGKEIEKAYFEEFSP